MHEHIAPLELRVATSAAKPAHVRFAVEHDRLVAPQGFRDAVVELIRRHGVKDVCEVGGGANPLLTPGEIADLGLNYVVVDISPEELAKADPAHTTIIADIAGAEPPVLSAFGLVFSQMLAEHLRDGAAFHRNVFRMLKPGGLAFHLYPTLYSLPRVINRLAPERLATSLLAHFNPDRDLTGQQVKFPAWYSWCEGPTWRQIRRLESIGFEVLDFVGIFGHSGYYSHVPAISNIHKRISRFLCRHEVAWQTSFATVLLRKPG
jgi:SAM-dependent methyltransferase